MNLELTILLYTLQVMGWIEDEIEYNSERWRVDSQIEGEQVKGDVVFKGFLLKRNLQT